MSLQLVVAVVFLSNGIQRTHKRFEKKIVMRLLIGITRPDSLK